MKYRVEINKGNRATHIFNDFKSLLRGLKFMHDETLIIEPGDEVIIKITNDPDSEKSNETKD